jgi:hypothetical protein
MKYNNGINRKNYRHYGVILNEKYGYLCNFALGK